MNHDIALYWVQETLKVGALMAAPMLITALVVGLVVSLFQALTSIQEMTLSYIPKMLAVAAVLLVLTPWLLQLITGFMTEVITFIPNLSR